MADRTLTEIEVYPVGLLLDIRDLKYRLNHPRQTRRSALRYFARSFARSWRRRSYWNGYLCEIHYPPAELIQRKCGRGWTRRGAARSMGLRLWEDNRRA